MAGVADFADPIGGRSSFFEEPYMPAVVDASKCDGCGTCQDNCPSDAIHVEEKVAVVKPENCIDCNVCADDCPKKAIEMKL
jgi:NAD-dependent dihydropyrimidine dehydrogenase PreA subunit